MYGILYNTEFFKTLEEAQLFQKKNGGAIYSMNSKQPSRQLHIESALLHHCDPNVYPYSVNWSEAVGQNSFLAW